MKKAKSNLTEDRLKVLLYNALTFLEEEYSTGIMESDLEDELGITQEEYDEVMNNV